MHMLAELVELVIGVDTHKDTHTAAVVRAVSGAVVDQVTVPATPAGYRQLLALAEQQPGQRVWAIEGTGGYGAGLTRFLHAHAEQVVELDRPKRPARRHGAKSDPLDATRAAREALARDHLTTPRQRGHREALRVQHTTRRAVVAAGVAARRQLGGPDRHRPQSRCPAACGAALGQQVGACAALVACRPLLLWWPTGPRCGRLACPPSGPGRPTGRPPAGGRTAPARHRRGPGLLLVSWSHPGRFRSQAALPGWPGRPRCRCPRGRGSAIAATGAGTGSRPGPAPHRDAAPGPPRTDPGLHQPPHRPGQEPAPDPPLPQTHPGPPALPAPAAHRHHRSLGVGLTAPPGKRRPNKGGDGQGSGP